MSQTIITLAFEQYKAQQEALALPIELNEFVLANVPNQDDTLTIDRGEGLPDASHIVLIHEVSQTGYVNSNAVVYSLTMGTEIGDFDFNWIGLRNKSSGVIAAICHLPGISKTKTIIGSQDGNSITRSIMMSYSNAQNITGINVDAATWQIDFTARLFGIDERERLANIDHYGAASFLDDGFKVVNVDGEYKATKGVGYVGGLRCFIENDLTISNVAMPSSIYLDASWQGVLTSKWETISTISSSITELNDHVDSTGVQHYVTKIAEIDADGHVVDTRFLSGVTSFERSDNAATDDDIDNELESNKHLKLPQYWKGIDKKIKSALDIAFVGIPFPWPTDIAPLQHAIMKGQAFDKVANPILAERYPNGILDDMRGLTVVGKKDGEIILAYEADGVKSHSHNASASSTDLGTKWTDFGGSHAHGLKSRISYGFGGNRAVDQENGTNEGFATDWSGDHSHPVSIGGHSHAVYVAAYGNTENTIKNRKFNWIVRMG
jgi:hypothetical protein